MFQRLAFSAATFAAGPYTTTPAQGQLVFEQPVPLPGTTLPNTSNFRAESGVVLDFDGDGRSDLLANGSEFGAPSIALRQQGATGQFDQGTLVPRHYYGSIAEVADFDGDGRDDIAIDVFNFSPQDGLWIYFGTPGPGPVNGIRIGPTSLAQFLGDSLALVDFDGDGDMDIVQADRALLELVSYINDGSGGFTQGLRSAGTYVTATGLDFDEDGLGDLVSIVRQPSGIDQIVWRRSIGGGAFAPEVVLAEGTISGAATTHWRSADVDGDGLIDALIDSYWLQNLPGTAFALRRDHGGASGPFLISGVADVDQDGFGDLYGVDGSTLGFQKGLGGGSFGTFVPLPGQPTPSARLNAQLLTPIDADGDLDLDMVVWSTPAQPWRILLLENVSQLAVETCPATVNSTGAPAALGASGTTTASFSRVQLQADGLPPAATTLFLTSLSPGGPVQPAGSEGLLCLGGAVGRFNRANELMTANAFGHAALVLSLQDLPDPVANSVAVVAPETRYFQAWFRDLSATGAVTSNFTSAVSIDFR